MALDLPTSHCVPITWIRENACAAIRLRAVRELLPPDVVSREETEQLASALRDYKPVKQTSRKQRANGDWAGNMLGIAPSKTQGIKDVGTVAQYRHLLELGLPPNARPFRLADRLLYRILSRDEDPSLLLEYQKAAKNNADFTNWSRDLLRQGATAALAHAGRVEDPRVRGSAHRIISAVSHFLRSELAEKPIIRQASRNVLHPDAYPPTLFMVAIVAHMPRLQRERAGFVERLGVYLGKPATKRTWAISVGKKVVKPVFHLLGEPLAADSAGNPKDLPFALHWIELLARLNLLDHSAVSQRVLARLLRDCDESGVWSPKNLRAVPKSSSKLADFAFPLEAEQRSPETRKTDTTFRIALIAKLLGWSLEYR